MTAAPRRFPDLPAPAARAVPWSETRHGLSREDEYRWMRAENWQEVFRDESRLDPAIRAHLEAENAYQAAMMADLAGLQATLVAEMRGRIREDDASVPLPHGPWAYGWAYATGAQHPRWVRRPRDGGPEEVLLDAEREAEGHPYFRVAAVEHSHDHAHLLWSADDNGSEYYTLRARDLATGQDLPDRVERTHGEGVWAPDGSGFSYVRLDDNHRPVEARFHRLGTPAEADRLLYAEKDPGYFLSLSGSRDGRWLSLDIGNHETSETWLLDQQAPCAEPRCVEPRRDGVRYHMAEAGDEVFVLTNADGAKDYKVMVAPMAAPQAANWRELVPHVPGRLILGIETYRDHLVRLEREDGLPRIVVRERASGAEHAIAFEEEAYSLGLVGGYEYDTATIRFVYASMTTPQSEYEYDLRRRERRLLKRQEVPSGHDPADYVTRRLQAPAPDGETVPVSILYRRDTPLDGSAPCLLYGYGAYGMSMPADFSTTRLSLVDRGFVHAIAHVRGGQEKGYRWYEEGKRAGKPNTFHDFVAAARHLVGQGLTSHDRIVAQGGSAGGMLMGAVANLAPEAFAGIVAEVPFVDVLNTMLDDTLPLTPPEWPEWGNPIVSEEDYRRIASYSPYDNVSPRSYPAILALAGLTDPRVTYWEPAKWVARLRARTTGAQPILLRVNMAAGHGGASGRFARLEEVALAQAFALRVTGRA